jgi:hypothetical protein
MYEINNDNNIKYNEIKNKSWRYDLLDADNWFNYFNIKISTTHKKFKEITETILCSTSDRDRCILEY